MPRIPRLFGRRRDEADPSGPIVPAPTDSPSPSELNPPAGPMALAADPRENVPPLAASSQEEEPDQAEGLEAVPARAEHWPAHPPPDTAPPPEPPSDLEKDPLLLSGSGRKHLDLVQSPEPREAPALETPVPALEPGSPIPKTLIGGKEDDLVPLIPDTEADVAGSGELDDTGTAEAAVESLKSASEFLVARVNSLRALSDPSQIVPGMITLVGELDARYTRDMGITRLNGLEDVLRDIRRLMAEGDRFILESLENGRGGLSADTVTRDLRTIAPGDRPRMLGHYVTVLAFTIQRVLHQYLRPLEEDETHTYEISYRLDYLVEGVREILLAKVAAPAR
ncbi:MAG: hypothetical protein ACRDGS_01845 [Chloroflexota bacterium]